jgi:hypothetical protein
VSLDLALTLAVVALAALWLVRRARRAFAGKAGCGCATTGRPGCSAPR